MLNVSWSVSLSVALCIFYPVITDWGGSFTSSHVASERFFFRHLRPSDRKQFQSRFCSNQTAAAVPLCTRPRGRPSPTPPHPTPTPPLTWIRIVLERKSSVDKSNALWRKPCETLNNWRSTGGRRPTNDSHGHLKDRRSRNNGSESVARPRTAHILSSVHQTAWVELSWVETLDKAWSHDMDAFQGN